LVLLSVLKIVNINYLSISGSRFSVIPILNSFALSPIQRNEVDRKLFDLAKKTKIFIKEMNNCAIFTRADRGNVIVVLDGKTYVSKVRCSRIQRHMKLLREISKKELL